MTELVQPVARTATPDAPVIPGDLLFQRLLRNRIIFLGQQVDDDIANRIAAEMLLLSAEDRQRDITVYINSPGGSVYAGLAIYDVMQFVPNDVATYAMGMAASMGQFLLTAGTPGKRYAMPNSTILMHQPSGGIGGTATDIKIQAEQMRYVKKTLSELTARHTGQPLEKILKDADRDHWYTAQEAKDVRLRGPRGQQRPRDPVRHGRLLTAAAPRQLRRPNSADREKPNVTQYPSSRYVLPSFVERTSYGVKEMNPYNKLFEERIIFLGVQIDDASANDVMAQLLTLEAIDPDREITMYINSPGGSMTSMMAIYDTMQFIQPEITTCCIGQAASAAAVLLAAGTKGKRIALPNSRILIHQPATEGGYGQASDMEIQADEIDRMRKAMETILARHTGRPEAEIERDIERDKFLSAAAAKDYGLIDEVLTALKRGQTAAVPVAS